MAILCPKNLSNNGRFVEVFDSRVTGLLMRLADELTVCGWRLATAESCTGGWIAKCCTDLAGSSGLVYRFNTDGSFRAFTVNFRAPFTR